MRPDIDKENYVQSVSTEKLLAQYDYVIIGEGSAEAVLTSQNFLTSQKDADVIKEDWS